MPVLRVLLMVLALLAVAVIAGAASGTLWYVVGRVSGFLPPLALYLVPALVVFGALFGWLLGRSPSYPGARPLAIACALYIPVRVLIAVVTEDTTVGEALLRGILLVAALYAAARLAQARRVAAMGSRGDAA
jgi:hypothetical protein